jgi:hypothetical protein
MNKQVFFAFAVVLVLGGSVCEVRATLVLDQEQNIYHFENYRPSSGYKEGQSFTAGLNGTLKQIDMGFLKTIDGDGTVEIFSGKGNQGLLLQMVAVQIYSEDNGQINYNSFIVDVPIESSLQYTFYFEPNFLTMPDPWYFGTSQTNPYTRGEWHEVAYGDPSFYGIGDIVFRTWVEPVPEPATLLLLGLGGLALLRKHNGKNKN